MISPPLWDKSSVEPLWKRDAWQIYKDALFEHEPSHVFALFSGGDDSTVLLSWAKMEMGRRLDAAVFIDTGTAIAPDPADPYDTTPSVRAFVEAYCENRYVPLKVYSAPDGEYERLVAEHGFPGPAAHRYAYVRLKERQVDRLVREHKRHRTDRIMLLTGVRKAESDTRMGRVVPAWRDGSQVWVAPLIDWTNADMHHFRKQHNLERSDVAALLHRSGECNCGAFASPDERKELRSLFPRWFARKIAPLEAQTGCRWGSGADPAIAAIASGELTLKDAVEAMGAPGPLCSDCQLRMAA